MKIAIFGATSEIAKDLIMSFSASDDHHELVLFARRPRDVTAWLNDVKLSNTCSAHEFSSFKDMSKFDAILNFVGAGDPGKISEMGSAIFDVTIYYDQLAVDYLKLNPYCRYIFMSSGAAYGSDFTEPADENTKASFDINQLESKDWYGVSKFYAECQHRANSRFHIVDIRIFNYFSSHQDMKKRFLMNSIVRSILSGSLLQVTPQNIVRDYIHPKDLYQLVSRVLAFQPLNISIDCYSLSEIDKFSILEMFKEKFNLKYEIVEGSLNTTINEKKSYYSKNKAAQIFNYKPNYDSINGIELEVNKILKKIK